MKTIILNIQLIFNILLSPLTASKEVIDHLTQEIPNSYQELATLSIQLSYLRVQQLRSNRGCRGIITNDNPSYNAIPEIVFKICNARKNLYILLDEYERLTKSSFPFPTNRNSYTPRIQKLTLNSPTPSGVTGKFTTTSTGLHAYKKAIQALPQSELSAFSSQLCLNIKDEHRHLTELKALLKLPEYQDETSLNTQQLLYKITECRDIITYNQDCLLQLMYPNKSIESLKEEAQSNSLSSVKLVLHKNGYFHIPKPSLNPDTPRNRPCNGLKRTATLDDFSSCGLSNSSSGNSFFVSVNLE